MIIFGCKEPYTPPATVRAVSYLVVDGFINTGQGATVINISRTRNVSDSKPSPELNAIVSIVDEDQSVYPLTDQGNGDYKIDQLNADAGKKYQVGIKTADGKQYLSDLVAVRQTPQIDSIHWELQNDGVHISVSTHDPLNDARFYRWTYAETWDRRARYSSSLKYVNGQVEIRAPSEQIYQCWKTDSNTDILIANSAHLAQDVILNQPINFISVHDEKMRFLYSTIVYQYAITEEAFEYWQDIKKNTEQTGSIFDAQPTYLKGNIHCVSDPAEPVIGFISACNQTSLRIFIDNAKLDFWYWIPAYNCDEKIFVPPNQIDYILKDTLLFLPVNYDQYGNLLAGAVECVDCRYGGGSTTVKPSFWP